VEIILLLVFAVGLNLLLFLPAYFFKTDKLTDVSYGATFASLAVLAFFLNSQDGLKAVLLLMILLWAARLGGFLFLRISKIKRDKRFDGIRENFSRFFTFWGLQGISVWIILLPSLFFFQLSKTSLSALSLFGLAVWVLGLSMETVADWQKFKFKQNPKNAGNWIEQGLWKYSRHPNYFGEILNWLGIYLFVFGSLSVFGGLVGFLSPLYISFLLIFVSGIPKLEKEADKRWGGDKNYLSYKKRTSVLIPFLDF